MRINLIDNLGINLEDGKVEFDEGLSYEKYSTRSVDDLEKVWYDKNHGLDEKKVVYEMYRNITAEKGKGSLDFARDDNNIRFDLTIIPPLLVGDEFVKTLGHYHPKGFGEVYQVHFGEAWYLLQSYPDAEKNYLIKIKAGETLLIPPGFGHVTINSTNEILIMTNFVSDNFQSDYEPYLLKNGASYFILKDATIKNESYSRAGVLVEGKVNTEKVEAFLARNQNYLFLDAKEGNWPKLNEFLDDI